MARMVLEKALQKENMMKEKQAQKDEERKLEAKQQDEIKKQKIFEKEREDQLRLKGERGKLLLGKLNRRDVMKSVK